VSGAAVPAPHAFGCRVTLEASLARQGEDGETIPLFSAWCFECYALDRDTLQSGKPDLMLASPHHHEDGLLFHSVIGTERILHLAPGESESFTLKLVGNTGCATVTTQFRITALYHDSTGRKRSASSSQAYIVQHERGSARVVIATL
jgi:hypothetical protein